MEKEYVDIDVGICYMTKTSFEQDLKRAVEKEAHKATRKLKAFYGVKSVTIRVCYSFDEEETFMSVK